eukprot:Rhum_TRINITY_DN14737_c16_g1::Rhum_TRINITY_DN14737_c16_g1_i3::g.113712::m.113712
MADGAMSPAGTSDGEGFVVSPPSAGVFPPGDDATTFAVSSPVFYEDGTAGWCVGVVSGYAEDGRVMVRDAQRSTDLIAVRRHALVPVPPAFSALSPQFFLSLRSLGDLPALPAAAREPAVQIALLHRMHANSWEVPVVASPRLLLSIGGNPASPPTAHSPELQAHSVELAASVASHAADRCVVLMPAGPGTSIPLSGRAPFSLPKHYIAQQQRQGGGELGTQTTLGPLLAVLTMVETLTCYSTQSGQASVSGMAYSMELKHDLRGNLRDIAVRPIAVDHSLAAFVMPYPPQDPRDAVVRSPYLVFLHLAESPLVKELGLPPHQTLTKLMSPSAFDTKVPTFSDARAALEMLRICGPMGSQLWAIVGAVAHLLIARWALLAGAAGEASLPYGVLEPDEHVAWAARCLQVPVEYVVQLVRHQGSGEGMQLDFAITEGALASLAGSLYDRLVHAVFKEAREAPGSGGGGGLGGVPAGFSTHIISVLPFQARSASRRRGYQCGRLDDRAYLVEAVGGFYTRHAPERAGHEAALVDSAIGSDGVAALLASLEGKYGRPRWFATRERLHTLYARCRPELARNVDDILAQYCGREDELFEALEEKYGLAETVRPPLSEQLVAFFERFDPSRVDEAEVLAAKWADCPDALETQLSEEYEAGSFLAHRREAWRVYTAHNPTHLQHLDAMLASSQYAADGDAFISSLKARYGEGGGAPRSGSAGSGVPEPSYPDLFRLMQNSLYEVFHLLYMHHFFPASESIPMRQRLVEMLISTAAPSIVASAVDTITAVSRHVPGEYIADEIVARFGGGYNPKVYSEGHTITVEHTAAPSSYNMSSVWGMNSDPVSCSALDEAGNPLVRVIARLSSHSGTTWVSRCVKEFTEVMATLGTVSSPTSWVLSVDVHQAPTNLPDGGGTPPSAPSHIHIPSVLAQLKRFYVDLISAKGFGGRSEDAGEGEGGDGSVTPRRSSTAAAANPAPWQKEGGADGAGSEAGERAAGASGSGGGGGDAGHLGPQSVAMMSAATQIQQDEWLLRHKIENMQAYVATLLHTFHGEAVARTSTVMEEYRRRCFILQAMKMRTVYTQLAEGMLRIERREAMAREKIAARCVAHRSLERLGDAERLSRAEVRREEVDARRRLLKIRAPVTNAMQRKEIRDAYETHILPFTQPSGPREGDINRFLELLEQREKYMPRGQQKMVDPEQYAAITQQPQQQPQHPPRIQAQPQPQPQLQHPQHLQVQQQPQPQQQLPPRWAASPGATSTAASPAVTTITAVPVEASPRRAAQKNPVGQRARPVDPEASAQRAARSASYDEEKQRILDRIRAIEESNGRAASGTPPPPELQTQPQKTKFPAAAQHAADLHRATKGLGTEEEAVFVVLSRIQSQAEWDAVRRQFRTAYPQFSGGDVVAVLREDMGRQEMDTCRRILSRNGVELEPAAAAAPAPAAGASARDGAAAAAVPPLPPAAQRRREAATTPAELADVLHAAMKGIGTDERAVFDVMERVRTQDEWDDVRARFRAAHPHFCNGSVVEALRDELNKKEMEVCRQILARKNIVLEPSVAAAAAAAAALLQHSNLRPAAAGASLPPPSARALPSSLAALVAPVALAFAAAAARCRRLRRRLFLLLLLLLHLGEYPAHRSLLLAGPRRRRDGRGGPRHVQHDPRGLLHGGARELDRLVRRRPVHVLDHGVALHPVYRHVPHLRDGAARREVLNQPALHEPDVEPLHEHCPRHDLGVRRRSGSLGGGARRRRLLRRSLLRLEHLHLLLVVDTGGHALGGTQRVAQEGVAVEVPDLLDAVRRRHGRRRRWALCVDAHRLSC